MSILSSSPPPIAQWGVLSRKELEALIDGIPAAVVISYDPEFHEMTANRAAYRLLRLPEGANMSFNAPGLEPPAFHFEVDGRKVAQHELPMRRAVITGQPVPVAECEAVFANGERVHMLFSAQPLIDAQGRVRGCLGVVQDVSARRRAEQELRDADLRKDVFLATLSHELRNPLAPIRNAVEVLRMMPAPDARMRWCHDVIDRQTAQLSRLLDDLLDLSRIRWGRIALQRAPMHLMPMIAQARETSLPLFDEYSHQFVEDVDLPDGVVDGDAVRLTQVFTNLLNNAAKYTPPGGRITLTAREHGDEVVVTVADNGNGLEPQQLARIFEPFGVDPGADRYSPAGGLGIGLSLVRGLVEMHGGTVSACSDGRGKGSVFEVRLPKAGR